MAEIWPRLKRKLSGNVGKRKSGRRTKSKANPYSSPGMEKFVVVLEGIRAQKGASLVERTASSLSAARSISRSAQEWTAATLVRSAGCAAFEALAPTKVDNLVVKDVKNSRMDRAENSSEERQDSSSSGPVRIPSLPERRTSTQVRSRSKSALVVLSAMGTSISTQLKPLASMLTFRAVIQVWHKGKLFSARLMFSSAALYFLTPLRSYLATRFNILPQNPEPQDSEIVISQPDSTSELFPAEEFAVEESSPASPVLLPFPESTSSASITVSTGKSRRLAKKVASRLKKLNIFRSSSSSSTLSVSEPSSPDRHRMCPFSKRSRSVTEVDGLSSSRKCIVMRRQRSADSIVCKKSLSSETLEDCNLSESSYSSSSSSSEEVSTSTSSSWSVLGLLITLLFLLVGRFPAIMATSLFFVVVSHDPAHSRAGRDNNNRALEAARKLQRSPQRLRN